ncbi:hypothetical protein F4824DRAFT_510993 [Ustulina deusta]|nr:hypothetical protein F4824DRAFT_510993 [Ustulina deusta]
MQLAGQDKVPPSTCPQEDRARSPPATSHSFVTDMISKFVETSAAKKASVTVEGMRGHGCAMAKLLKEAERLRHILSANVDAAGSFKGLYEDIDFRYKVSGADFKKIAESHVGRVGIAVQKALDVAELDITQINSIILHGGASRTPFVQKQLEKFAGGDKLRGNVNSDEAAVFGTGYKSSHQVVQNDLLCATQKVFEWICEDIYTIVFKFHHQIC